MESASLFVSIIFIDPWVLRSVNKVGANVRVVSVNFANEQPLMEVVIVNPWSSLIDGNG